jgi:hypothetical protein
MIQYARRLSPTLAVILLSGLTACSSNHANRADSAPASESGVKPPMSRPYAVIDGNPTAVPKIAMGDPATVARIIEEGTRRNQVMDHLTYLTQSIGPRLTGSSRAEEANRWTADQFRSWGLTNVGLDQWGEVSMRFDRGPSSAKVMLRREREVKNDDGSTRTEVEYDSVRDLEFSWLAWAPGTNGAVRAPVVRLPKDQAEFDAVKDTIAGSWVLIPGNREARRGIRGVGGQMGDRHQYFKDFRAKQAGVVTPDAASGDRFEGMLTGANLPEAGVPITITINGSEITVSVRRFHTGPATNVVMNGDSVEFDWVSPSGTSHYTLTRTGLKLAGKAKSDAGETSIDVSMPDPEAGPDVWEQVLALNPAGFLGSSRDERVWTTSARGWRELSLDKIGKDTEYAVRQSDYDYINSRLYDGIPVEVEINAAATFTPGPIPVYNTVAEIRGTEFPDEVVIISAHLDSWDGPGSQGTLDNGTGSAVTLEAARILMAAKAKPKRTIRFVLWTGEEQGLLGSRSYVDRNKDALPRISAVFVDDGGTNYEGGAPVTNDMADMMAAATAPTNGLFYDEVEKKWMDVNIRKVGDTLPRGGGSDHASFNAVGVPGFFWDEIGRSDYQYGWHTQNDKLNLAIPEYLRQSATNAAITAYNLACAPTLLPRVKAAETPASGGN